MEKLCLDKNDEFLMIPILCPPLMEEFFEQIYKIFIRSFAVGERERYPKRNYSLIGLDENPLAIIQKLNPIQKLRDHYDIKLDANRIMRSFTSAVLHKNTWMHCIYTKKPPLFSKISVRRSLSSLCTA